MLQVSFKERCGQQDLFTFHAPNQAVTGLSHNIVFLGVCFHEVSNIIATDFRVLKDQAHLTEFLLQVIWYTNIHFHAPKQTLILHLAQYPCGTHNLDFVKGLPYFGVMKHCSSRFVFFVSRHSHSHMSTTR